MYWASLRGPRRGFRAQGWGLELQVIQAGDVHLQGWMVMEGRSKVSTLSRPSSFQLLLRVDRVCPSV